MDVLDEDLLEDGEESLLEGRDGGAVGAAHDADRQRQRFEQVVVEVRPVGVARHQLQLRRQAGQRLAQVRHHGVLQRRERAHDGLHHVLVLLRAGPAHRIEQVLQQRLFQTCPSGNRDVKLALSDHAETHFD